MEMQGKTLHRGGYREPGFLSLQTPLADPIFQAFSASPGPLPPIHHHPGVPIFLTHLLWPSREQALWGHTALHSTPAAAVHEISFSWPCAKRAVGSSVPMA